MSALPYIGASLDEGLLARGRLTWKDSPICVGCRLPCFPRGFDLATGLCWFCRFPRIAKSEAATSASLSARKESVTC